MIQSNGDTPSAPAYVIRPLDYAAVLLRRWRAVMLCVFLALAGAATYLALKPDVYTSWTVLVPSPDGERAGGRLAGAEIPAFMAARLGSGSISQKLVGVILDSRSLRDSVAARAARAVPGTSAEEASAVVYEHTRTKQSATDGSIRVEADARNPRLAAAVASQYQEVINELATDLTVTAALRKQAVLEAQLTEARERLARSEERVVSFQQRSGAADVQEQAKQGFQTASVLQQQILQQEIEVSQLSRSLAPANPRLRAAQAELASMRAQLRRLAGGGGSEGIFLGPREVPGVRAEATRLIREFTKDEQVYVALTAALANAQADVRENLTVVTVLDPAFVPRVPASATGRVLVVALILGMLCGLVLAFMREYAGRVRHEPGNEPFLNALDHFRSDVGGLFRRGGAGTPASPN